MFFVYADVEECASNPCQNGAECVDDINGFSCSCAAGFTGELCDYGRKSDANMNAQFENPILGSIYAKIMID